MVRTEKDVLDKIVTFAAAVLTGKKVSLELFNKRLATCTSCDEYDSVNKACGICGCKIAGVKAPIFRELTALAAYEENLPSWGCKHPERGNGKGWQE